MTIGTPPLRGWQQTALDKLKAEWEASVSTKALIAACPGAGKTFFTVMVIRWLLHEGLIDLAIVIAPTVNIQLLWVDAFKDASIKATFKASNMNLRWRVEAKVSATEDNRVLVLSYSQLAQDSELIAEVARRGGKVLVVGDEIHHADDVKEYGSAIETLADACERTLALSGTPFNSVGGSIALCEVEDDVDDETGKPIRKTIPTYSYSYGQALRDRVCRQVEFLKVSGRGEATFRLISGPNAGQVIKHIIDLAKQRKGDRINTLLDPDGEFMQECACQAVRSLVELREAGDKQAAMLVVAKDKQHGKLMADLLQRVCEAERQTFYIQEIYNDTPKAHDRVDQLKNDSTDIIVSVRMISEGVDVKRLRVGLFATDWLTRMFFIQFVGRFIRMEDRLDKESQFARVIIPAHINLLEYAKEIEEMVEAAAIASLENGNGGEEEGGEGGGDGNEKTKSEFVESKTTADALGVIHRGEEMDNLDLAEAFYQTAPTLRGVIPHALAIRIAEGQGLNGAKPRETTKPPINWSHRNDALVRLLAKRLVEDGYYSEDMVYGVVNGKANKAVGIAKKDALTPENTLIKRHAYLKAWWKRIVYGKADADDAAVA